MLEIRPICENCGKILPNESSEAMICTFECTFCSKCVEHVLFNVCPNCGGGFEKRPTRPNEKLIKHPPKAKKYLKPIYQGLSKYRRGVIAGILFPLNGVALTIAAEGSIIFSEFLQANKSFRLNRIDNAIMIR